jgi:hypothetical protein
MHAQARDGLLRGTQESRPVQRRVGLKKGPLTTRYVWFGMTPFQFTPTARFFASWPEWDQDRLPSFMTAVLKPAPLV